jgi:hypothetical protein
MQIKNVLAEINRMQNDGVIASYAIGGAVGAKLYLNGCLVEVGDEDIERRVAPGFSSAA